ncbi:MAG: hypothetical protein ACKOPS_22840, partial [Cyanobium sp.]
MIQGATPAASALLQAWSITADPLCGSGTLLIEAVRLALGRAPGLGAAGGAPLRRFALERWPDFDA